MSTPASRHHPFFIFLLFACVLAAYIPALSCGYVNWDDDVHFLDNPFTRSLSVPGLADIFSSTVNRVYIPLTTLSFALERHFFGTDPFVSHLINLLLHLAVTALTFRLAIRLGLSPRAAFFAALVFGLHPIRVQSVAWVTERKDVLYAAFYLLSAHLYLDHISSSGGSVGRRVLRYAGSVVCAVLSILAKPMAVSLLLVLPLLDWFMKRSVSRRMVWDKVPYIAVLLPAMIVTYVLQARLASWDWPGSVLLGAWSLVFYLKQFLWPDIFLLIYPVPAPIAITQPEYLGALAAFAVMAGLIFVPGWRLYRFAFWWFLFSIFFLIRPEVTSDIDVVADRFFYLPGLGFAFLAGAGFEQLMQNGKLARYRMVFVLAALGIVIFLGTKTFLQCRIWNNGVSLWTQQFDNAGHAAPALIYHQLAQAHTRQDDFRSAVERVRGARRAGRGPSAQDVAKIDLVKEYFRRAVNRKPDYANAYFSLGKLHRELGEREDAKTALLQAVTLEPSHFDGWCLLGEMAVEEGAPVQAVLSFKKALIARPRHQALYGGIMAVYRQELSRGQAVEVYGPALAEVERAYQRKFGPIPAF